jgi:hypothetical protein
MDDKKRYLTLYDYGTGGVWSFIYARSEEEILRKYSELQIIDERIYGKNLYPPDFSEEEKTRFDRASTYDIDDAPTGFLRSLIDNR